jgi:hypothetical protein
MTIYQAGPDGEGEEVFLACWSIRQSDIGGRHFLGFNVAEHDGRVSTPIVSFDPRTRTGVTASGRKYHLLGKAGFDKDADYVWGRAAKAWSITSWSDITHELCPDWRNPIPEAERDSDATSCAAPKDL